MRAAPNTEPISRNRRATRAALASSLAAGALVAVPTTTAVADPAAPVISEVMFNPASSEDDWEWVELFNPGSEVIDLAGWVFDDANSVAQPSANIATGTIPAGGSAVLYNADDLAAGDFEAAWGAGVNLVGVTNWNAAALNNGGDTLALWSSFGEYDGDNQAQLNSVVSASYAGDLDDGVASIYLTDLTDQTSFALSTDGGTTPVGTGRTAAAAGGNSGNDVGSPVGDGSGGSPSVLFTQYVEGSSFNKAIEIGNPGSTPVDITGWQLELYSNGNASPNSTSAITNGLIAAGDVYVAYNSGADPAIVDVGDEPLGAVNWNGDDAIVLRDDGGNVVDSFGQVGFDPGSQWSSGGVTTQNETLCRNEEITTGDTDPNDPFDPSAEWSAIGNDNVAGLGTLDCVSTSLPTPAKIHEIQGDGPSVAIGGPVSIEAIVTSLFTGEDALSGFFVQEEDGDADADPDTSEGIFVFCGERCPAGLAVGDLVEVTGTAGERFEQSQIDASSGSTSVISSGNPLPTATPVTLPAPGRTDAELTFEPLEGMVVEFAETLVVAEYFELARFGSVVLTDAERDYQFTHDNAPSVAGYEAFLDDLERGRIILDDDNSDQNDAISDGPDERYPYPTPGLTVDDFFRGGDSITGLTGVMDWAFDQWRIRPVQHPDVSYRFDRDTPRPETAPDPGGSLKVASFNVLNYFTTIDVTPSRFVGDCGPSGTLDCRGADSEVERDRQLDKIVSALVEIDADIVGLIEVENNAEASLSTLVDALNAEIGSSTYDYVSTGTIGTDAIKVGVIYQPSTVEPSGSPVILDSTVDPRFVDTRNRPVLVQTFDEIASGERLTVAVNHLKSKGSDCDDLGDPDLGDGQGNCNVTRTNAALALADFLATDPTGSGDPDALIIGDLNAYRNEDPITSLEAAGYTDLLEAFIGDDAYGFVFDGQLGYLDHALANATMLDQVAGVAEWQINADEINLFDYNDDVRDAGESFFERKSSVEDLFTDDPFRSSDHDPVIVGLDLSTSEPLYRARNVGARIVIERNVELAGLGDIDPDGDGWAVVGRTNGAGDNGVLANFFVEDGVPFAATRHPRKGCLTLTPRSLDVVKRGQVRLMDQEVDTADCRAEAPDEDTDGDGTPDDVQDLYTVEDDGRRLYLFRSTAAAEAQLGVSDWDPDGDGRALFGRTNGAGEYGTLVDFGVRPDGTPEVFVEHRRKGCQVLVPNRTDTVGKGQTRRLVVEEVVGGQCVSRS